jgi:transcriptional regulator with XRE-family HTH domain
MTRLLDNIDKDLKKAISKRITELREQSGKNQTQFAYDYGKDKQTQNKFEKGRGATIYTINKFCNAIEISLSDFFDSPLFKDLKTK